MDVIPLWDNFSPIKPACVTLDQDPSDLSQLYGLETQISTLSYYCPPRPPQNDYSWLMENLPQTYYNDFQPDLLITVNFTTLGMPVDSIIDIASNSIQVRVAMSNNTADVVAMTTPTILIPGVNLVGLVSMEVHQTFTNPGMATLGLFENLQSTLIGQVAHLYPDSSPSPLIAHAPEIATLRLSVMRDATQWNIIRDTKKNTFLSGFSKIGGLWTFLSGIFAAIFGSSLIRILFGIKPISVFGLAHRWERGAISKAYRAEYPAIQDEMAVPSHQRGLLCLIQDHIVDLDLIDEPDEYSDVELESKTKMLWPYKA
ncbi:hypothetical protein HYPSUDRAFT_196840 [Hypholoma sublateritium FD-334 SS-4]|uniref:Uncharacterized protein n=1 Tax=Hypholoma sublateritium (strain FD-334 SS-4) TaxID=945553 RepID=A0A0D2LN18_HYPSF|nr:hypothetical protein HYPSUDRAFT_196840 [Hypholoma sublateritium FD-334 SS-4]